MTKAPSSIELLQQVDLAVAMRESVWLYPAVETAHILGFIVLVGAVAMFDLRVLGISKRIPVRLLARHLLPWSLASLAVILPAGFSMFLADAVALVANRAFVLKMLLLVCAGANAVAFHLGPFRNADLWDSNVPAPRSARVHAVVSLLLWGSIVTCGRGIAYV